MHVKKQHGANIRLTCANCGFMTDTREYLMDHIIECDNFEQPKQKECKHFLQGNCSKGNSCKFLHNFEKYSRSPRDRPTCRNGNRCRYLANGICSFFHRGIGVQNPPQLQQTSRGWCTFLEDCYNVPNCQFIHYEEDFPKLSQTNSPPIRRMESWWQDY